MKKMTKLLSALVLSLVMVICLFTPMDTQAATSYVTSKNGEQVKCGKYTLKRTTKGIYRKSGKTWKKIVSATSKNGIGYGFTSNGSYIYYASMVSGKKSYIYRIKVSGKSKKTIYKAKHMVNVLYYYGGRVLYYSDLNDNYSLFNEDGYYTVNTSGTKKYKLVTKGNYDEFMHAYGSKMLFSSGYDLCHEDGDGSYDHDFSCYDISKYESNKYNHKLVWSVNDVRSDSDEFYSYNYNSTYFYYAKDLGKGNFQVYAVKISTGKQTAKTEVLYDAGGPEASLGVYTNGVRYISSFDSNGDPVSTWVKY